MPRYDFGSASKIKDFDSLIAEMTALCFNKGVDNKPLLSHTLKTVSDYFRVGLEKVHPVKFVIAIAIYQSFREIIAGIYPLQFDRNSTPWPEINQVGLLLANYLKDTEPAFGDTDIVHIKFYLHYFGSPLSDRSVGPEVYELLSNTPS